MITTSPHLSEAYQRFETWVHKQNLAFGALELLSAGLSLADPKEFELTEGTAEAAMAAEASAREEQQKLTPDLERFEEAAARRLSCCVRLLAHAEVPVQSDAGADPTAQSTAAAEAAAVIDALKAIAAVMPDVWDLQRFILALTLVEHNRSITLPDQLQARVDLLFARASRSLDQLRSGLGSVACPQAFEHVPMTLASRCGVAADAPADSLSEIVERTLTVYNGMLGTLVTRAVRAESRFNIENT